MAYATKTQLAAVLPGITAGGSRDTDLDRVLNMATLEIDRELDYEETQTFDTDETALLTHVCLERAADLWHMEQVQSGLLLGGESPLLAPRNSWDRYAHMLAPLKSRWGVA